MRIETTYKFRLYPNKEQETALSRQFGACRFVYNRFLRERIDYHAAHKDSDGKKGLTFVDTCRMLTELKKDPELAWLREPNAQSLQQSLGDLDRAYNAFFNRNAKFPRFKSRRSRQAFRIPQYFRIESDKLVLPKVSPIRMVVHRPIQGEPRHVTISRTPTGKFFAAIMCLVDIPDPVHFGGEIGIDLGLKSFLTASNGEKIEHPRHLLKATKRLARLQRKMSRKKPGSSGKEKARRAVALQHEKVANRRADFLHKMSSRLVRENQTIHAESLNVKGMLSNHRLARRIFDSGWAEFLRQLDYKGQWAGGCLDQVDRFYPSSKRCHVCGRINEKLRLSDRTWTCDGCRTLHDRDHNAAINILNFSRVGREPPEFTPVEIPHGIVETGNQPHD